jgi:uncharacterized repeat protein (TIGR04076 family)
MKTYAGIDLHSSNNYIGIMDQNQKRIFGRKMPNDMEKILMTAWLEGKFDPWMINENEFITCCTYGLEPVVFKVERIMD